MNGKIPVPYNGNESFVFVSYAHRDKDRVYPIICHMNEMGLRVWFDEAIAPGTEWDDNIARHVHGCDAMIAFISAGYLDSENCRDELNYARDLKKNRLLIYLEDIELPPGMAMRMNRLQAVHWDKYTDKEAFYQKLMQCEFVVRNRSEQKGHERYKEKSQEEEIIRQHEDDMKRREVLEYLASLEVRKRSVRKSIDREEAAAARQGEITEEQQKRLTLLHQNAAELEKEIVMIRKQYPHEAVVLPGQDGNIYRIGSYWTEEGKKGPVEWKVLDQHRGKMLLITEKAIEVLPFANKPGPTSAWKYSYIREWLNNEFYREAFTETEAFFIIKSVVTIKPNDYAPDAFNVNLSPTKDKLFLLSYREAARLFRSDRERIAVPTDYAAKKAAAQNAGNMWLLRTNAEDMTSVSAVDEKGIIRSSDIKSMKLIRPAMWVSMNAMD